MSVSRVIEVLNSDSLEALQYFLAAFWAQSKLDAMLAPVLQPDSSTVLPQVITDPAELQSVNPFAPIMQHNAAGDASQFIQDHPDGQLAILLRPCELRALIEIEKRYPASFKHHSIVVLGVDCIGTYPRRDFLSGLENQGLEAVTAEVLRNATEGGLIQGRFRTACQVCDWPAPCGADLIIGTIGIPSDEFLLIKARDDTTGDRLGLRTITKAPATEYQVSHRETMIGAIADMRAGVRRALVEEMRGANRFNDLGSFLAWFATCNVCGKCLKACPLYKGELDGLLVKGDKHRSGRAALADLVLISRWVTSCAGCGMCEESCEKDVPLTLLISALSHRIRSEMHYKCGDPAQQLPWMKN